MKSVNQYRPNALNGIKLKIKKKKKKKKVKGKIKASKHC
jgi:hypothetical protein